MAQKIIVTVTPAGDSTVAVTGVKGSSCTSKGAFLAKALGKSTSLTHTSEYYDDPDTKVEEKVETGL